MISTISIPKSSTGAALVLGTGGKFILTDVSGLGAPAVKSVKDSFPLRTGGRLISQFYDFRRIVISGIVKSATCDDHIDDRNELVDAFTFDNEEKDLTIVLRDATSLMASVTPASPLRLEKKSAFMKHSSFEIELDAVDPLLYGSTLNVEEGGITTIGGGFTIPFTIPFAISGGITNAITCVNAGNARVYPERVVLYGPGTDYIVENRTLSQALAYTGTIADGDYVEIDMKNRTALYNGLANVYGNVSGYFWQLAVGSNTVSLTVASGNGAATAARVEWYDAYLGV